MVATPTGANESQPAAYPTGRTMSCAAIGTPIATATPISHSQGVAVPAAKAMMPPRPAETPAPTRSVGRVSATTATAATSAAVPTVSAGIATTDTPVKSTTAATTSRTSLSTGRPSVGARNSAIAIRMPARAAR